jgi:serine/threonine protein kinase
MAGTLSEKFDATQDLDRLPRLESKSQLPAPGQLIAGAYRILRELGTGAMGTVLLAFDEHLAREVAVKFLDANQAPTGELTELLRAEARAMARIRHPNVVQIHSFGVHDGVPYFVMEYVPGPALVADDPAWKSLDVSVSVLEQVCLGLEAIHRAGAVHNDLKPGNVLVGPGCRVVVADFGLATVFQRSGSPLLVGTPAYISPEVARGETVDPSLVPRRDIYALGVMAFEMLVGQRPFRANAVQGLLQQHAYEVPPRATELRPELPHGFDDFFARALAKDPAQRISSAERFRHELLALQRLGADGRQPLRIILAEDDPATRQGVVELIQDEFPVAEIRGFDDGESAYTAAQESPPDVVVTDLHMPGRGGVGLTTALRRDPRTSHVPIIVVTGEGGSKDWEVLCRLGADRFLVKPLAVDSLISAIRAVTRRSGS